ncbi:hypothetical protein [Methylobacter sp.]|uniref:hypothetical protein n=1 Tax=Methylobacter sp. TaxID=2051955 RepID=UPI002FDD54D1
MAGKRRLNFASFTTKERLIFPAARAISCYLRTGVFVKQRGKMAKESGKTASKMMRLLPQAGQVIS